MTYVWIAVSLVIGLLLGKLIFGRKPAPEAAAVSAAAPAPAPKADDNDDEIAAVITAIAAAMGCAPECVRLLSLREDSPWKPTFMNTDGGQIDEKIPDKNKWKNV